MKHHSEAEIDEKLRHAEQLLAKGDSQAQACKQLRVSVVTYHRWRKLALARHQQGSGPCSEDNIDNGNQIEQMRTENALLRRMVTDLLLEKMKADEPHPTIIRDAHRR